MEPKQKELFDAIWNMVEHGEYLRLAVYCLVLYFPMLIAWITEWRKGRAEKTIYKDRIADKDQEIERLAARIKDLENVSLKTKRK